MGSQFVREQTMNLSEFFNMGGYAFYVWSSWLLSVAAMLGLFILAKYRNAKIRRELKLQLRRRERFAE